MMAHARILAISIALLAMTLRALVPAGWMPVSGSQSLVLCTIEGRAHIALDEDGKPVKPSSSQGSEQQLCSFGVAANLALADSAPSLNEPTTKQIAQDSVSAAEPATASRHAPQSPRAPPSFS